MRELLSDTLRRDGYTVLEATSVDEAFDLLAAPEHHRSTRIDLVLSDVRLGGETGLDLGRKLRAVSEEMPLILMTAFPEASIHRAAETLHAEVLAKPFRLDVLRRSVLTTIVAQIKRVLARERGSA